MDRKNSFVTQIINGYACNGDSIVLGSAILDGQPVAEAQVKIPLKTMNRHGSDCRCNGNRKNKNSPGDFRATCLQKGSRCC